MFYKRNLVIKDVGFGDRLWIQVLSLPFTSCVTLGKIFFFFNLGPRFPNYKISLLIFFNVIVKLKWNNALKTT